MKNVKVIILCCSVILVSACGSDSNDSNETVDTPSFTEFTRDIFQNSANAEPKKVELGVTFKITEGDSNTDFSDLL